MTLRMSERRGLTGGRSARGPRGAGLGSAPQSPAGAVGQGARRRGGGGGDGGDVGWVRIGLDKISQPKASPESAQKPIRGSRPQGPRFKQFDSRWGVQGPGGIWGSGTPSARSSPQSPRKLAFSHLARPQAGWMDCTFLETL